MIEGQRGQVQYHERESVRLSVMLEMTLTDSEVLGDGHPK